MLNPIRNTPTLIELPSPTNSKTGWPWTEGTQSLDETMADGSPWPKVTLVTPSYNQAEYLEETIRSVLLQGYPNLEYIIIDGGSTDGSVEIIQKYKDWMDYWISEPDKGQADAINKGFERATGEFIGWLNSDDYLYPNAIVTMATALIDHPDIGLVYGDVDEGLENHKFRRYGRSSTITEMLTTYRVPIPQQGSLWRRKIIEEIDGLDRRWQVVLDREFFLRIAANYKLAYVPGTLAFFRYHPQSKSISASQGHLWLKEIPLMYQDFFENKDISRKIIDLKSQAMTAVYLHCASRSLRKGNVTLCLAFILKAIQSSSIGGVILYIYKEMRDGRVFSLKLPMS